MRRGEGEETREVKALPPPGAAALVFVAAGSVLMLEILAVRLLAPYVGLTLETTTSIIGAALAGIALGAAVGGYVADRTNTRRLLVGLLVGGGLLTLVTVPAVRWLGPGVRGDGDLAALGIAVVALVPAASVLSAVSPAVAHLQLHDLSNSGTIVGRLSAWATAGALIGTFGTGFVIVPLMPIGTAVLIIGALLVLVGVGLGVGSPLLTPAGATGIVVATIALGALSASASSPCLRETGYHCISLEADPGLASGYNLLLDGVSNSYVDVDDPTDLKYRYVRWIAGAIDSRTPAPAPLDAVFVGGGGFTLPRWLVAAHPNSDAEVLEVDGGLVEFAEDRLGLRPSPKLRVTVGDARVSMLDVPRHSADVVVGDAFSGYTVPWSLTTAEWLEEVKRVLKPGGFYAMNTIDFQPLEFLKAETATMMDAFANVHLLAFADEDGEPEGGNQVLLGSDRPLPVVNSFIFEGLSTFSRPSLEALVADSEGLRDDYAPVDQLRTIDYPEE
jgi:MFS family permease